MKPVYVVNGFLESGKTEFIVYTLSQPYFEIKGKTLLILCEEGEQEYEEELLRRTKTVMERIEDECEFTPEHLLALEKKHKPERILIEFNGMWNYKNVVFPKKWQMEQQITTIDASTFLTYYANMRSLMAEMLRESELILFNRCDGLEDLSNYKRSVKAINQRAEIIFEDANGEIDALMEEELPYDLNAEIIPLRNPAFGVWYLDALDHLERYVGKKIEFVGNVLKPESFPKGYFVPGRMAMTCCADDMAFLGFVCYWEGAETLENQEWVRVIAEVRQEFWPEYEGEGPVLYALQVTPEEEPEEPVISFV